mmetsp:Transcript_19109/g.52417  ORF Transcript_19109/g.52417 Transcript_19109/m.52417 type:complete len:243 (-) Transcript_19109:61-789(-)
MQSNSACLCRVDGVHATTRQWCQCRWRRSSHARLDWCRLVCRWCQHAVALGGIYLHVESVPFDSSAASTRGANPTGNTKTGRRGRFEDDELVVRETMPRFELGLRPRWRWLIERDGQEPTRGRGLFLVNLPLEQKDGRDNRQRQRPPRYFDNHSKMVLLVRLFPTAHCRVGWLGAGLSLRQHLELWGINDGLFGFSWHVLGNRRTLARYFLRHWFAGYCRVPSVGGPTKGSIGQSECLEFGV